MGAAGQGDVVPGFDSDVFKNASTITSWLQKQPDDVKVHLAGVIFSGLLREAAKPQQSPAQACMKLCGLVHVCTKSTHEGLRQWAFSHDTSMALFTYYIEWKQPLQTSSMKLMLDVLVITSTQNPDPEVGARTKTAILDSVVTTVSRQSKKSAVKASVQSLVHFLGKHAVSLDGVKDTYRKVKPSVSELPDLQLWGSFAADVFSWMDQREVCPIAGKLLLHLLQGLQGQSSNPSRPTTPGFSVATWLGWVQDAVLANPGILEIVKNHVFWPLFNVDRPSALQVLADFSRRDPVHVMDGELDCLTILQLAGLEVGKKAGLVEEPGTSSSTTTQPKVDAIVMRRQVLEAFLIHPSHRVRSSALGLLVASPFTTKPISQETFNLFQRHLATYHSDDDIKLRHEMLGYSRILIGRVKNVIIVTKKSLARPATRIPDSVSTTNMTTDPGKDEPNSEGLTGQEMEQIEVLERHESFIRWYIAFLKDELIPTASYQRHITALRALYYTLRVVKRTSGSDQSIDSNAMAMVFTDSTWVRIMLDLVMDSFDDVRETAATILQMLPQKIILAPVGSGANASILLSELRQFCTRATSLAGRTSRADHGNGAARAQGLLCSWLSTHDARIALIMDALDRLEAKLSRADEDLGHAVVEDSVHVDFAALGYIWQVVITCYDYSESELQALEQVQRRMFKSCDHIWNIVQHVLCDDSPEGHLPEELEEVEGLDTRDLLSYSFRAIHESSNLMRIIASRLKDCGKPSALYPPLDVFSGIGSLTFTQLSTLRHRGAFATVTSTFATCCQMTLSVADAFPDISKAENYLQRWYEGAIGCIMNQASTTRRSAGIPALVIGILAANAESLSFKEIIPALVGIAEKPARNYETDGSKLPQVHALNCLKDIFRSSGVNRGAEPYLPTILQLAASSLKSELWAIRNCGLILFRSLIDCLLGTGDSKSSVEAGWDGHTIRISYAKYPSLPGVLLGLLKTGEDILEPNSQSSRPEAVFPALDIIRRAGPPEQHRDELYEYIERYLGSHLWHLREMVARTLCSFLLRDDWVVALRELLSRSHGSANRLHGALLAIKFVLLRKLEGGADATKENLPQLVLTLNELLPGGEILQKSPEVQAALLEISNILSRLDISKPLIPSAAASISSRGTGNNHLASSTTYSALLQMQLGIYTVYECARHMDVVRLQKALIQMLEVDVDTACTMLKTIPEAWQSHESLEVDAQLGELYLDVQQHTKYSEPRELTLLNLRSLMDNLLQNGKLNQLPSEQRLQQLQAEIQLGEVNPSLSQVALEISGTLMAARIIRGSPDSQALGHALRCWGNMLAEALDVDNTCDTRLAAVKAMRSFSSTVGPRKDQHYLPYLLALYDALNDDDDEVRDVSAAAAESIIGKNGVSLEATDLLVVWLARHFSQQEAFRSVAVCRLAGQETNIWSTKQEWIPAEELLSKAMKFDDSLFAVEKQNLFIDEIRESTRWLRVFKRLAYVPEEEPYRHLRDWAAAGLRALNGLALNDDGPLGWTCQEEVFALCGRILLCARALCDIGDNTTLRDLLEEFAVTGRASGIHGSLLRFAEQAGGFST